VIVEYRDGVLLGPDGDVVFVGKCGRLTVEEITSGKLHWCLECGWLKPAFSGPHCAGCEEFCRRQYGHCSEGCGSPAHVQLRNDLPRCVPCQQVADRGLL